MSPASAPLPNATLQVPPSPPSTELNNVPPEFVAAPVMSMIFHECAEFQKALPPPGFSEGDSKPKFKSRTDEPPRARLPPLRVRESKFVPAPVVESAASSQFMWPADAKLIPLA